MSLIEIEDIQLYENYTKCGEILQPPSQRKKQSYILRCLLCENTFVLLAEFIFHMETHVPNQGKYAGDGKKHNVDPEDTIKLEVEIVTNHNECPQPTVNKYEDDIDDNQQEFFDVENQEDHETLSELNYIDSSFDLPVSNDDTLAEKVESDENDIPTDTEFTEECVVATKRKLRVKKRKSSVTFTTDFFNTGKNVTALIESYKSFPDLWNNLTPQSKLKSQKEEAFQKLAIELGDKLVMTISCDEIKNLISHLRKLFLQEFNSYNCKADIDASPREGKTTEAPLNYFQQLQFLEPFIKKATKTNIELPQLNEEQLKIFLDIYKNKPCLWNTHLVEYHCKNKRQEALTTMLTDLEAKCNVTMQTVDVLQKYLSCVDTYFMGEKRRRLNGKTSEKCKRTNLNPDHYELLQFLNDHLGPFKCCQCEYAAQNSLNLRMHISQHDGTIPFSCTLCDKQFQKTLSFKNHAKRHMDDCQYSCPECSRKFLVITDLKFHMRIHTGAKPFCCDICGQSFRHSQSFNGHMRRHEKRYLHFCHICNKGFYSRDKLNNHVKAHLQIRDCICIVCGKAFTSKRLLDQHKVIHEDVRKFACQLCGKTFKHKTGVNQHMKTHGVTKVDTPC